MTFGFLCQHQLSGWTSCFPFLCIICILCITHERLKFLNLQNNNNHFWVTAIITSRNALWRRVLSRQVAGQGTASAWVGMLLLVCLLTTCGWHCPQKFKLFMDVGLEDRYVHCFKHICTREVCYYWVFCTVIAIFLVSVVYSWSRGGVG